MRLFGVSSLALLLTTALAAGCPAPSSSSTDEPDPRPDAEPSAALCSNTCSDANDGVCDDGGDGAQYDGCALGTDCNDCGTRANSTEPDPSPSASPEGEPSPAGEPSPSPDGEPDPSPTPDPDPVIDVECGETGKAVGTLRTSIADIPAHVESVVTAEFAHKIDVDPSEDACVGGFYADINLHPNGCRLVLVYGIDEEGNGSLVQGYFEADSYCSGVSDDEEGTYTFSFDTSPGTAYASWIDDGFERVPDAEAEASCFENRTVRFPNQDLMFGDIVVNLGELRLLGSFDSRGSVNMGCRVRTACPSFMHHAGDDFTCVLEGCFDGYEYTEDEGCVELIPEPEPTPEPTPEPGPGPGDLPPGLEDAVFITLDELGVGEGLGDVPLGGDAVFVAPLLSSYVTLQATTYSDLATDSCSVDTVMDLEMWTLEGGVMQTTYDDDGGSGNCSQASVSAGGAAFAVVRVGEYGDDQSLSGIGVRIEAGLPD